ncbi:hypothetical protein CAPTEDRAFT_60213, partial [Capitella teleta]
DVFNMDETALFFKLEPDSTLATAPVKGKKKSKERITVALCANATGSEKLKPLVIGRAKRPRCFTKGYCPSSYVDYKFNKKAWMTGIVFADWMTDLNTRMMMANRRVLLLLDNASSHTPGVTFSHVTLRFLPPNTTSHIQPMDAGIIRNFKLFYRQQHVRHLVRSWGSVKRETISNCWRHTGLTSQPLNDTLDSESSVREDIAELTSQLPIKNPMNAADFIAVDDTEQTSDELTDGEIVLIAMNGNDEDEEEDGEDPPRPPVTTKECHICVDNIIRYCEENRDFEKHLTPMLSLLKDIECKRTNVKKQKTMFDFFKK